MRVETVRTVLSVLGSYHPDPKLNSAGTWGACSCPLAPWTHHGSGRDMKPSLMVSVEPGRSNTRCMSCGFKGGMLSLVNEVHRFGGIADDTLDELRYLILLEETQHFEMLRREAPDIPESFVACLDTWHPYWGERGFDRATARSWRLGYDAESQRAIIPFFDMGGNLVGLVGRDITGQAPNKYDIRPSGFDRSDYLFGEHRVTGKAPALLLVEGYTDAISASMRLPSDVHVVALGSAIATAAQLRKLKLLTREELILGLDADEAGRLGASKVTRVMSGTVKLSSLDYGGAKDANELGDGLLTALSGRREVFLSRLTDTLQRFLA